MPEEPFQEPPAESPETRELPAAQAAQAANAAEVDDWRPDALARSRHSRLASDLREPGGEADPEAAAALCAEICRKLLGDFAPALLLLGAAERRRVQTLLAYTHTLFDFARQRGVEGERLAQINRWEWSLELALAPPPAGQPSGLNSGQPSGLNSGQPVFVAMAHEHARRPWPEPALDELAACARRRATRQRPATAEEADAAAGRLARACAESLLGEAPPPEVAAFAGALVRLVGLQNLGPETAAHRCPLPLSELAEEPTGEAPDPARLLAAAGRECERLRPRLLKAPRGLIELPAGYRRAAVFSLLAALSLLTRIEEGDGALLARPPHLGLLARLALLARARWLR